MSSGHHSNPVGCRMSGISATASARDKPMKRNIAAGTVTVGVVACVFVVILSLSLRADPVSPQAWDARAAATHLDGRAAWWMGWAGARRDHDTFCVSCHTAMPYALARPALRSALGETGPSATERKL